MRSLRSDLLKWLLGALGAGALMLVLTAYLFTLEEINEVLDDNLREVAGSVAQYHVGARNLQPGQPGPSDQTVSAPTDAVPDSSDLLTLIWRPDGTALFNSNPRFTLPFTRQPGAGRIELAGEEWRTFTMVLDDAVVQAAQRTKARQKMAVESASRLIAPLSLLIALLAVLMMVALRRGLRPWDEATAQIALRSATSLEPIAGREMPREMQPLVSTFNALMKRLADAFAMQRRFVADAAHELRSPITALRLQLNLLRRAPDEASREEAAAELQAGIDRSERLVEQLLQLSRAQPEVEVHRFEPVLLDELVRSVVIDFNREAIQRGIDLGASPQSGVSVPGDALQLRILLNNLVRNALRYSPSGAHVDVVAAVERGKPVLRVIDDGPGIPAAEIERVFDRFRRGAGPHVRQGDPSGSGLGLAIVRAIAESHGACATAQAGAGGMGLEVRVVFGAMGASR